MTREVQSSFSENSWPLEEIRAVQQNTRLKPIRLRKPGCKIIVGSKMIEREPPAENNMDVI